MKSETTGRRHTARHRLIEAGYRVLSSRGFENSSIAEIIEEAGVGVGSFYNHFSTKDELAAEIFALRVEELGADLEWVALNSPDMAAATCYAFRRLIDQVQNDRVWAAFVLQLEPKLQLLDKFLRPHARKALSFGMENSTLDIDDLEVAITSIHAVMFAVARSLLEGHIDGKQAHEASRLALRMFGLEDSKAHALSRLSMSQLNDALALPTRDMPKTKNPS